MTDSVQGSDGSGPPCLLDTSVYLKYVLGESLPERLLERIGGAGVHLVSWATVWEMAVKTRIGKLSEVALVHLHQAVQAQKVQLLDLDQETVEAYLRLTQISDHRDPFDLMILATAKRYDLPVITTDQRFAEYEGITVVL
ncbi:MAG: type II toxin-antitoxin system VapC family toxin [Fimbriimonadaceae bacterium]|nr:type II toxin-antitoxin system VapC family toxin [Fimbriimonadaceae bacterium]